MHRNFAIRLAAFSLLSFVLVGAIGASAADEWQQVGSGDFGKVAVNKNSVRKQGDGVVVTYRLDFPKAQHNSRGGKDYLSTEIRAHVICATGTIARFELTAYSGASGTGEVVGGFTKSVLEVEQVPIENGGSDADVWHFLCDEKPKKGAPTRK